MKYTIATALLSASFCAAQLPSATPPAQSGAPRQVFAGLNEVEGVSVDRFLGHPESEPVHLSHGTLLTHAILKAGNPNQPGAQSEVLEYRKLLATAQLLPEAQTPLEIYPDEYFFYVEDGEGRLDDGKMQWTLKPGIAVLMPPGVAHRLVNTSLEKTLTLIMLQWTGGPDAKKELIVRDTNMLPWCEENAHWNNTSHCIFGTPDGLLQGERIYAVMLQPWAVSQPHSHSPGTEEIWTKISPGSIPVLFGSDLLEMPQNSAYLVPPTGKTDHSNINVSKDKVEWWIYIARGPNNPNRPTGQATPRPFTNPNLSRDTAGATVAGRLLR
jgi:mannose-6-phosphate isomerase-like protein (cupin superfamily)